MYPLRILLVESRPALLWGDHLALTALLATPSTLRLYVLWFEVHEKWKGM